MLGYINECKGVCIVLRNSKLKQGVSYQTLGYGLNSVFRLVLSQSVPINSISLIEGVSFSLEV